MLTESAAAVETPAARPHFIEQDGRHLFAWHHPARPTVRRGAAVVLCPPLGSDYICVYRVWRILAERLAGIGFDVLRFDYEGTGDSAGDPEEPGRLEAWLRNIERVVTEARELTGSSEVALVGLRIGATLALHAAVARGGVDRLVLWSPFRSGRAYVRELKALARLSGKDHVTEGDKGADILDAGYAGHVLRGPIARALERLDLVDLSIPPAVDVLLVDRDDRSPDPTVGERLERLGSRVTRVRPVGTAEMLESTALSKIPGDAVDAITNWLGEWPSGGRTGARAEETRARSSELAHGAGYYECGVRFGPADRLFGILSVPSSASGAPAIIFLNTNFEYRVGPHRLYVPLARELAAQGHLVLRYDLGGIGDSAQPAGASENVAYPVHALDDAREAIAFIRKQAPGRQLIVAGLCSGGWHAFCAAREGLAVDAIVSINPPLYLREGLSRTRRTNEYQDMGNYRRALRDPARWAKALRGRSAYGSVVRQAAACVKWEVAGRIGAALPGHPSDGLARDLNRITARGITSFFVFSRGDAGLEYFQLHASPGLRRRAREHIRHVVVDDADHTFSSPAAQHALRDLLLDFVVRQTPTDPS